MVVRTPESALAPLIHAAPTTGLEGKFSLQYAVAATLLDGRPGIESFTDEAVARPAAQALAGPRRGRRRARAATGCWPATWRSSSRSPTARRCARALDLPPGRARPPAVAPAELAEKVADCAGDLADEVLAVDWASTPRALLRVSGRRVTASVARSAGGAYAPTRSASRG